MPNKIIIFKGKEFLAEFKSMMADDYKSLCNSISIRYPQAKTIVESLHQTIGNIIQHFKLQNMGWDNEKPWEEILSSTMFTIWSIMHSTTQYTPSQLVFGGDMILNINQEANWQLIQQRKKALLNKGNQKEITVDNLMCTALETKCYWRMRGKQSSSKPHI